MIDKLVDCGFEVAEINAKVKVFKNNGITKKTIQTLLSDAKSMYLSDDVVKVIGQNTGNSDLLARLVLKNGDEFSNALLKTTVLDDFCDLAWKYGMMLQLYLVRI